MGTRIRGAAGNGVLVVVGRTWVCAARKRSGDAVHVGAGCMWVSFTLGYIGGRGTRGYGVHSKFTWVWGDCGFGVHVVYMGCNWVRGACGCGVHVGMRCTWVGGVCGYGVFVGEGCILGGARGKGCYRTVTGCMRVCGELFIFVCVVFRGDDGVPVLLVEKNNRPIVRVRDV